MSLSRATCGLSSNRYRRRSNLLLAFLLAIVLFPVGEFAATGGSLAQAQLITVDPGHGGTDPGGSGNGMNEKDIVLDTSLRLLELLRNSGADGGRNWTAEITRDTDVFIPLAARASYANQLGADRFTSIHANAFSDPQANGTETFSAGEPTTSSDLRDLIQEEMIAEWGLRDRGGKTANFTVLTNTSMPATLSELGFVTNTGDAALLASLDARQRAAEAHLRALEHHFEGIPEPTGSILVQVTLDEAPLAAVPIHLDGAEVGRTNEEGSLLIEGLGIGTYQVRATLPDIAPFEIQVEVTANNVAQASFTLEKSGSGDETGGCLGCSTGGNPPLPVGLVLVFLLLRRRQRSAVCK